MDNIDELLKRAEDVIGHCYDPHDNSLQILLSDLAATILAQQAENAKLREALQKIEREIDSPARFNDRVQNIIDAALIKETPLIAAAKEGE